MKHFLKRYAYVIGWGLALSLTNSENFWMRGAGFAILGFLMVPIVDTLFPKPKPDTSTTVIMTGDLD